MGTKEAALSAVTTKNIQQALDNKKLTRSALALASGIASSTLYRNLSRPEKFTLREIGQIAEALDVDIADLIKDAA